MRTLCTSILILTTRKTIKSAGRNKAKSFPEVLDSLSPCTHRRTCRSRSCGSARTRPPGCGARFRNSVNCSWTRGPFCQHFFPTLRRLLRASSPRPVGAAAAFSGGCPAGVNRVWTTQGGAPEFAQEQDLPLITSLSPSFLLRKFQQSSHS